GERISASRASVIGNFSLDRRPNDHAQRVEPDFSHITVRISHRPRLKNPVIAFGNDRIAKGVLRLPQQHVIGIISQPRKLAEWIAVGLRQIEMRRREGRILNKWNGWI